MHYFTGSEFHWPREFADRHRLDMLTPLLLIERRLKCTVMCFPKCLGGLAANVFGFDPECNNCTPSDSKRK